MHWYKRDPDAALAGMAMLTLEECGAYNKIIDILYSRDGDLADDDNLIAKSMNVQKRTWTRIKKALLGHGKIWILEGKIGAKRVENTLKEAAKLSQNQSEKAAKRWQKPENNNEINGAAMPGGNASTTTTTTTPTKKESFTLANGLKIPLEVNGHKSIRESEFEKFWKVYPRKEGKKAAEAAFAKAIKETTLAQMLTTLAWQTKQWRDPKYIPHPATWLNKGRWADENQQQKDFNWRDAVV